MKGTIKLITDNKNIYYINLELALAFKEINSVVHWMRKNVYESSEKDLRKFILTNFFMHQFNASVRVLTPSFYPRCSVSRLLLNIYFSIHYTL